MKSMRTVMLMAAAAAIALPASASIYMDENFEDSTPFSNQNWPIQDDLVTLATNGTIAATQGVNIRSSDGTAVSITPSVVMNNTGTLSASAAFSGTQGLQLASGQSISVNGNSAYPFPAMNWYNVIQFAVSANAATFALPASTQVGHFRMNYSNDGAAGVATVETVYQLNLVRNASGGIDIIVQQGGAVAGTITAAGAWAMVSVLVQKDLRDGINWEAWDPLRAVYIGPPPTDDPFQNPLGLYAQVPNGINVFVNNSSAGSNLSVAAIGNNFCNDPALPANEKANSTYLLNWEIVAENSGTLYVDETFWAHGLFQNDKDVEPLTQEGASRLNPFGGNVTAVRDWNLY